MSNKHLKIIIVTILASSILILSYLVFKKIALKERTQANLAFLPVDNFFTLDSARLVVGGFDRFLLVYFNSTCEQCQNQIHKLKDSIGAFSQINILLVSSEPIKEIKTFSIKYNLSVQQNLTFVKINSGDVYNTFGSVSSPHIFIYNEEHRLIKEFRGETKIENLLKYLR